MRLKYGLWQVTFVLTCAAMVFFPEYRLPLFPLLAAHIIVFVNGVANIRTGFFGPVHFKAPASRNMIALTFDDGPDPGLTPDILDILKRHSIKATFFVIGREAEKHPGILKRACDEGHTVGCHDLTHGNFSNFRFSSRILNDISEARRIIGEITGKRPLLYRPPVGLMNPHVPKALRRLNMRCIGWCRSAGDAGNRRTKNISRIHDLCRSGAVVLLHDCLPVPALKEEILRQIDILCGSIRAQGLEAVGVEEMFGFPACE